MNPAAFAAIASFMRTAGPSLGSEAFKSGAAMDIGASALQNAPKLFTGSQGGGGGPTTSMMSFGIPGMGIGASIASRVATKPFRMAAGMADDVRSELTGIGASYAANPVQQKVAEGLSSQVSEFTRLIGNLSSGSPQDVFALGKELATLPEKVKDWGAALKESQRSIAQFSGELMSAVVESDVKQMLRDMRMAQETSSSGAMQIEGYDALKDALFPIERQLTESLNTSIATISGSVARMTNDYFPAIIKLIEKTFGLIDLFVISFEKVMTPMAYGVKMLPGIGSYLADMAKAMSDIRDAEEKKKIQAGKDHSRVLSAFQSELFAPGSTKPKPPAAPPKAPGT